MTPSFQMTRPMHIGTQFLKSMLRLGVPMGPLRLLAHRGRKSGSIYTTPVALVQQGNTRWLVAAFGEVNWVRNIRAAGTAQLVTGRRRETIRVVEVGAGEAAPVLKQFLRAYRLIPFFRPYFDVTSKSPLAEFEHEALHHPVFRIVNTDK